VKTSTETVFPSSRKEEYEVDYCSSCSGRCTRCALDELADSVSNTTLSTSVDCEDDVLTRADRHADCLPQIVLFSNGRTIDVNLNTEPSDRGPSDAHFDGDDLLGATAAAAASSPDRSHATDFRRRIPSGHSFTRGVHPGIVQECPLCGCGGFTSVEQLTFHVDAHFAEQLDDSDWAIAARDIE
jgi:hypothetical protein